MKKIVTICLVVMIAGFCGSQTGAVVLIEEVLYSTIQDAVDAAVDGDVIKVVGGTYAEQVEIRDISDLSIEGSAEATITVPIDGMIGSLVKIVNC